MTTAKPSLSQARKDAREWIDGTQKNKDVLKNPVFLKGLSETLQSEVRNRPTPPKGFLFSRSDIVQVLVDSVIGIINICNQSESPSKPSQLQNQALILINTLFPFHPVVLEAETNPLEQSLAIIKELQQEFHTCIEAIVTENDTPSNETLSDQELFTILQDIIETAEIGLANKGIEHRLNRVRAICAQEKTLAGIMRRLTEHLSPESPFKVDHLTISIAEHSTTQLLPETPNPIQIALTELAKEPEFEKIILLNRSAHFLRKLLQGENAILTQNQKLEDLDEFGIAAGDAKMFAGQSIALYDFLPNGEKFLVGTLNLARKKETEESAPISYNLNSSTHFVENFAKQLVAEMKRVIAK